MAAMLLLICCSSGCRTAQPYGQPWQGQYLYLQAGVVLPTLKGPYRPATDEKWVNPDLLKEKDALILELQRALERAGVKPFLPR